VFQAIAGLWLAPLAPQQASELVARVDGAGLQGQDGEQRPILLARQFNHLPAGQPDFEAAEKV
jgi:hypothetical protein